MFKNTLFIFPLIIELKPVLDKLKNAGYLFKKDTHKGSVVYKSSKNDFILALGGHGKVQMALQTQSLIQHYKPQYVIGLGCCGALDQSVELLEVRLIEQITEHDYREGFSTESKKPIFQTNAELNQWIKSHLILEGSNLASGDEDIISHERAQELKEQTRSSLVAWESAGLARACLQQKIKWSELRMVSDFCNQQSLSSFKQNLKNGMPQFAEIIIKLTSEV